MRSNHSSCTVFWGHLLSRSSVELWQAPSGTPMRCETSKTTGSKSRLTMLNRGYARTPFTVLGASYPGQLDRYAEETTSGRNDAMEPSRMARSLMSAEACRTEFPA